MSLRINHLPDKERDPDGFPRKARSAAHPHSCLWFLLTFYGYYKKVRVRLCRGSSAD